MGLTPVITSIPLVSCRKTEQPVTRPAGAGPDPGDLCLAGHGHGDLLVHGRELLAEPAAVPHHPVEAGTEPVPCKGCIFPVPQALLPKDTSGFPAWSKLG